jgi:phosphate:Na+ symporter
MQGVDTVLNVLGSVCLLLWGVRMVRTGLTRAFGATLRRAIGACARNRFTAFAGGVGLTGILQSSTATALLLASFASRGLIPLSIALAVMLGANVGTTLTAQVLSFNLGWVSPFMIAVGVIAFLSNSSDKARHLGRVAIGLGLMLLSLHLLEAAAAPLRASPAFVAVLSGLQDEYVLAVIFAAAATWFVHSSLSSVLLVMSFASTGIIEPKLGLALIIGANIGGAIAPLLRPVDDRRRCTPRPSRQPDHACRDRRWIAVLPRAHPPLAGVHRSRTGAAAGEFPHRVQRGGGHRLPAAERPPGRSLSAAGA